jgi:F-type H+-transporting ATPase subunit epsilon
MTETLRLQIVTPLATVFAEDVEMVTLPGIVGEMGVYPNHEHLITQIVPGEIMALQNGQERLLAVGEGLVEVSADRVEILTDMAIAAEDIDEARAEEARAKAAARLQEKISGEEIASTNAALARSLAQLQVKRRRRG